MTEESILRLHPAPQYEVPLEGLYLQHAVAGKRDSQRPHVYTNFIASLDGRIAIEHPSTGGQTVPESITNPRDWRLFQELAAQADVLVTSARYLRELAQDSAQDTLPLSEDPAYADLHTWRREQGLAAKPAVVILSASLDLPLADVCESLDRTVYVATGDRADNSAIKEAEQSGATVLCVGEGDTVDGRRLINALVEEGFHNIYSMAGPGVLETLLEAGVLDRLYLTQVHRLIGGEHYHTLLEGSLLNPPADFMLQALYYDPNAAQNCGQFFGIYDAVSETGEEGD